MNTLVENDIYKQFLKDDFDVKTYASQSIQLGLGVADQLAKLSDGIVLLDKELRQHVAVHYEDLLCQITSVETLEEVLKAMHLRIQSLLSAVERLRLKVVEPYKKILTLTNTLSRLQSACDLLRSIVRISFLTRKLQSQLQGGSKEITKCAQTLNELKYVSELVDLSGLEVITKEQKLIRAARKEVETQAIEMLERGIEQQNQSQVATALQVFHNLGILSEVVFKVVSDARRQLEEHVKDALSVQNLSSTNVSEGGIRVGGPGRAAIPSVGSAALFRANLWTNVEKLTNEIYTLCSRIQHLQKVLCKKRDPVTHTPFIQELFKENAANDVALSFWNDVTNVLTKEFIKAADESTYIKQAFEGEFPKLLRLYSDLWRRMQQFSSSLSDSNFKSTQVFADGYTDEQNITQFNPEVALRATLVPFKNAYHSRSLSRLIDRINVMFSSGSDSPPKTEEVESFMHTILAELNVAAIDCELAVSVSKNVASIVQMFVSKCEEMVSTDAEASQVIGPPNSSQINNAEIVDILDFFDNHLKKVLKDVNSNFPNVAVEIIMNSAKAFRLQMAAALQPLLSSISSAIESIILTMHDEDFSTSLADDSDGKRQLDPCSLYMKELQDFILRVHTDYLMLYKCADFISDSTQPMASRTIELFIRHASLLRSLGEGGKRRLAADFAQMEKSLLPLCPQLKELGRHYRMLRAFRPLLFQTPEHIIKSPIVGDALSFSTVLQFLFSKAPSELRSPYQTAGWSLAYYSKWLDEHPSESDRIELIHGALESYVTAVRLKQEKEFVPVYPLMLQLLQRAMQQ